ncbi:hypothetical protein SteCoe_19122 [Stentor coeruleus]|uniref:Uncharacterized protein n=1 Tax=Stentor coeruleus TaxID=5963 RepID=A0A1R2BUZ2_9CILI|nr:hypothetical protein SteCoe_19122 [Stentor coeruleus]
MPIIGQCKALTNRLIISSIILILIMNYLLFILALALKNLEATCVTSKTYDLTSYTESSTNVILTCGTNSPVNAVISKYPIIGPQTLVSIWNIYDGDALYHCTMTEYFFVPAVISSVIIDEFADDYILLKINDVQVTEIPTTALCTYQQNIDITSYIRTGLNKLYIDAYSVMGQGYFGYRIKIKSKFSV